MSRHQLSATVTVQLLEEFYSTGQSVFVWSALMRANIARRSTYYLPVVILSLDEECCSSQYLTNIIL